jgi:hypothetical protein
MGHAHLNNLKRSSKVTEGHTVKKLSINYFIHKRKVNKTVFKEWPPCAYFFTSLEKKQNKLGCLSLESLSSIVTYLRVKREPTQVLKNIRQA